MKKSVGGAVDEYHWRFPVQDSLWAGLFKNSHRSTSRQWVLGTFQSWVRRGRRGVALHLSYTIADTSWLFNGPFPIWQLAKRKTFLDSEGIHQIITRIWAHFNTHRVVVDIGVTHALVLTRIMLKGLWHLELCSPFLKGGNSAFIKALASGLFPQTEYWSLE